MHILQVAENAGMLSFCDRFGIKHIYDYAPNLIDNNWKYLLLKERGIKMIQNPLSRSALNTSRHPFN